MGLERLLEIVLRAAIRLVNAYLGPSSPLPPPSRPRTTPVYASVNDLSRFFSIHSYPPSPFMSPSSLAPFSFFSQDTANRASRKTLQTRKITRHCGEQCPSTATVTLFSRSFDMRSFFPSRSFSNPKTTTHRYLQRTKVCLSPLPSPFCSHHR